MINAAKSYSLDQLELGEQEFYERSDFASFELFVELTRNHGVRYSKLLSDVGNINKSLYHFAWTPEQRFTPYYYVDGRPVINSYSVPHHAMHILVRDLCDHRLRGYPRTTLYSEALSSGLDAYFELAKMHRGHTLPDIPYQGNFQRAAQRLFGERGASVLERFARDPFDSYQRIVAAMNRFLWLLMEETDALQGEDLSAWRRVEDFFYDHDESVFFAHYDYAVFISYTLAFCGRNSEPDDKDKVASLETYLECSRDMEDFIGRLRDGGALR